MFLGPVASSQWHPLRAYTSLDHVQEREQGLRLLLLAGREEGGGHAKPERRAVDRFGSQLGETDSADWIFDYYETVASIIRR